MPVYQTVKALVKVRQGQSMDLLEVVCAGPSALTVAELPVLRMINDIDGLDEEGEGGVCCLSNVEVVGEVERSAGQEVARLKAKYGPKFVDACYPGGRGTPKALAESEIPDSALAPKKAKAEQKDG